MSFTDLLTAYPFAVPAVAVGAFVLSLIAIAFLIYEHARLSKLLMGQSGVSLEQAITTLARRTKDIETFRTELEVYLKQAEIRMQSSIRGIATVRFNPFKGDGSGGDQSFATALITEGGDGFIISTLYSRDRVSVFGKPILKGTSTYELTEEEREALKKAQEQTVTGNKL